ncbi:MAG: hypothetical protein JST93_14785 [Acidobacteria bacterium]|nr:hypothetical protein [Acidobacteriota bacterium]
MGARFDPHNPFISASLQTLSVGDRLYGRYVYNPNLTPTRGPYGDFIFTPRSSGGSLTFSIEGKADSKPVMDEQFGGVYTSLVKVPPTLGSDYWSAQSYVEFAPQPIQIPADPYWKISFSSTPKTGGNSFFGEPSSTGSLAALLDLDVPGDFMYFAADVSVSKCIDFKDPVSLYGSPSLLEGAKIKNDIDLLASSGRSVDGIAADGVSQVVVSAVVEQANQLYSVTVLNDVLQKGATVDYGGVAAISGPPEQSTNLPAVASTLTDLRSVTTSSGPRLLFVYRAPVDFPTVSSPYGGQAKRMVSIRVERVVNGVPLLVAERSLTIVRAPTMLIHGIWSEPTYGFGESGLVGKNAPPELTMNELRYDGNVTVRNLSPDYGRAYCHPFKSATECAEDRTAFAERVRTSIKSNSFAFDRNAKAVLPKIVESINAFRSGRNALQLPVAAAQADIVAHSMGGLVTRSLPFQATYFDEPSFRRGRVHKLITISTPHLGSPTTIQLHSNLNTCVRYFNAMLGAVAIESAEVDGGPREVGGSWALQGDTSSGFLSAELRIVRQAVPIPTALIYGQMGLGQLAGLDSSIGASTLRKICGDETPYGSTDPMAVNLTSRRYKLTFNNEESDASVSVLSSTNGRISDGYILGAVHSKGMVELGFGPPHVTQEASGIRSLVLALLGTNVTLTSVFRPDLRQ